MASQMTRDVIFAFAQRRERDAKDVESVIQILAQQLILNGLLGRSIGGRDHAHVHRNVALAAEAAHGMILQHAQQFGLRRHRHIADFVEQNRTGMRLFKASRMTLHSAGERAFSCPKSSLSISVSGMAAQLTAINGPTERGLELWSARATNSLPVPLSPVINTAAEVGAT